MSEYDGLVKRYPFLLCNVTGRPYGADTAAICYCRVCNAAQVIERLERALELAFKEACPYCAEGIPTDKEWEHGNSDGIDRKGLMHPHQSMSGHLGGGYIKCRAWKAREALATPAPMDELQRLGQEYDAAPTTGEAEGRVLVPEKLDDATYDAILDAIKFCGDRNAFKREIDVIWTQALKAARR